MFKHFIIRMQNELTSGIQHIAKAINNIDGYYIFFYPYLPGTIFFILTGDKKKCVISVFL